MSKFFKKELNFKFSLVVILASFFIFSQMIVFAENTWVGPTASAPQGNVPAPINVSSSAQHKIGPLTIGHIFGFNYTTTPVLPCDAASAGYIRYNVIEAYLELCNGTAWTEIGSGGGAAGGGSPVGEIASFPTETCPSGWIETNGSAVSRATYSDLFAKIGTTYGDGDGSTTFNLPDYRGKFMRGWSHGTGNDPNAASRADRGDGVIGDNVGTKQNDELGSHTHSARYNNCQAGTDCGAGGMQFMDGNGGAYVHVGGSAIFATGGSETRPKNINVLYCINTVNGGAGGGGGGGGGGASLPVCSNGQILSYNTTNSSWECANNNAGGGGGGVSDVDIATVGKVTASSTYSANYPEKAFDGNIQTSGWGNNNSQPSWLLYDFGVGNEKVITSYKLYNSSTHTGYTSENFNPRTWEFQASNDGATWTTLDSIANGDITQDVWKEFTFTNSTAYRYYRIYITASESTNWVSITEMELLGGGDAGAASSLEANAISYTNSAGTAIAQSTNFIYDGTDMSISGGGISTDSLVVAGGAQFDTNTLYVNQDTDKVGIGTVVPSNKLTVENGHIELRELDGENTAVKLRAGNAQGAVEVYNNGIKAINLAGWSGENSYIDAGNFGIGTTSPAQKLHIVESYVDIKTYPFGLDFSVNTTSNWARSIRFRNEDASNLNDTVAFGTLHGKAFISAGFNEGVDTTGYQSIDLLISTGGNVGIGTTTPQTKLDVDGIIKTQPASSRVCNAAAQGGIMYDSDDNHFYGCNGSTWVQLDN